ncbi:MAG: sugar phosphate nucleotidyltransferase [Kiritimatiellae bacterium]|nr:sugar phosphate nucleotidyltransferase [Kiritimatiellia bacterium]
MTCLPLALHASARVRKAVIPAAGFGTRLFPATKAVKKELFPVVDRDGRAKPAILTIIEEALAAGVDEVAVLVQARDKPIFEEIFCAPPPIEHYHKLSLADRQYCDRLLDIGHRLTFLTQDTQEGFGHAVYCARQWVGREPFLLLLGDHLYTSSIHEGCARQVVAAFEHSNRSAVGLAPAPAGEVHHYGCVTGRWHTPGSLLDITEFAEKPTAEYAAERLTVDGLPEAHYLTVFGIYVLKPEIFDYLEANIRQNVRESGEFQLTTCLDRLRREDGFVGQIVQGRRHDLGNPRAYLQALADFHS